jgi:hypothetical protein
MLKSINQEQGLYVIAAGNGYSCLGFDVCAERIAGYAAWLGVTVPPLAKGTREHFEFYETLCAWGFAYNARTGARCDVELTRALIGLEGKRVEIAQPDGETRRFWVGKSTGWAPCHLEIARRNSTGGPAVYVPPGSRVRIVSHAR